MDSETRQAFESIEALTCPQGLYDLTLPPTYPHS